MNTLHTPLFTARIPGSPGIGFHNIGRGGVLRAANETTMRYVQDYYGERCGHLPLNLPDRRVLMSSPTPEIRAQILYLASLFGKSLTPVTFAELQQEQRERPAQVPLIVPYINTPEAEAFAQEELGGESWGLPGRMTHILKNKASFYQLADEYGLDGFYPPDYRVVDIQQVARESSLFLGWIEDLYHLSGLAGSYPLGLMLRVSEEDGNYGCCLVYEEGGRVLVVQDGDSEHTQSYVRWEDALTASQSHLAETMNIEKESRVVMSRYLDVADSPGISVVVLDDEVVSLGWNGQLQKPGSKACVGTSTYTPANAEVRRMQQAYEEQTATFFEAFLRQTAQRCAAPFAAIKGVANLDIMIPSEQERRLRKARKQPEGNYLAECNPRWTNYTDAILTLLGATRREQTIAHMQAAIAEGICTLDKHYLPAHVDPQQVRARIAERDELLQAEGTRIICRMAKNPMGLIFAGDVVRAQQEVTTLLAQLAVARV